MILLELISDKDKFLNKIKNDWLSAKDTFPDFLTKITSETKSQNEDYIKYISSNLQKQLKHYRRLPIGRNQWRQDTFQLINEILYNEEIFGMHHYMNHQEIDVFCDELKEFLRNVRSFAPELTFADIGQAIRNYIVYAMFKKLHRDNSGFNLAGFGYSMLYPFTDNYIDNRTLSAADKKEYNQLIRDKIKGLEVHPRSVHQKKTCELLQDIEILYPRNQDDTVYQLLLMMLDAQEISLCQQSRDLPLSTEMRLDISVYKGGISVLMDRFFVHKVVTEEDLIYFLGFGFFLQLADDLQDIKEDNTLGHSTLFTTHLQAEHEEKIVNKMFHFIHQLMEEYLSDNESIKHFLLLNCYQLICSSTIKSKEFFSQEYFNVLEQYLPVTCLFWDNLSGNNIENKDNKTQSKYMKLLDELVK